MLLRVIECADFVTYEFKGVQRFRGQGNSDALPYRIETKDGLGESCKPERPT